MPDKPKWLNAPITTTFGAPSATNGAPHYAIDFAVPAGTAVESGVSGTVLGAFHDAIGGNQIVVKTDKGFNVQYAHLSQFLVNPGDAVNPATVIARSGASGDVTGPHLHVGVTTPQGAIVSPLDFFNDRIPSSAVGQIGGIIPESKPGTSAAGTGKGETAGAGSGGGITLPNINITIPGLEEVGKFFQNLSDFFQHGLWRAGLLILGGGMFITGFWMYTNEGAAVDRETKNLESAARMAP